MTHQTEIQFIGDALALLGVYVASIIFTFVTHKHLFAIPSMKIAKKMTKEEQNYGEMLQSGDLHWSVIGVVLVSEVLVNSVEVTIKQFGISEMFVGAIVVGIVGNVAEQSSTIMLARKGKLDLSIALAAGCSYFCSSNTCNSWNFY